MPYNLPPGCALTHLDGPSMRCIMPDTSDPDPWLEECDLCHDTFPFRQLEIYGSQLLCEACAYDSGETVV